MAGMWLVVRPTVMRAISVPLLDRAPAVGRPPAMEHHLLVVVDVHAGHRGHGLQVAEPVGGEDLRQEVDVAAEVEHRVVVAVEHRLLLGLGHRPLVQVGPLASLEPLPVLGLHQAHAELVQLVALLRALRREHPGAGYVIELRGVLRHVASQYRRSGLSTSKRRCRSLVGAMRGMTSTRLPSSGMWLFMFGCGQSVPQMTRSGKVPTMWRANGTTSAYSGGPEMDSRSAPLTLDHTFSCSRMKRVNRAKSGPSTGCDTSGRPMWSTTTTVGRLVNSCQRSARSGASKYTTTCQPNSATASARPR